MNTADQRELISKLVQEVLGKISPSQESPKEHILRHTPAIDKAVDPPFLPPITHAPPKQHVLISPGILDLTSSEAKSEVLINNPDDYDALVRMKSRTCARIGVGRCGPRLNTRTLLTLRADHAAARDAVFKSVDNELLDKMGIFTVQTQCQSKNEYLTRPDLGRILDDNSIKTLESKCTKGVNVQIYVSDGLSSTAVNANMSNILPVLMDGLKAKGLSVGTPFFVKYGRVAAMDHVSEILNSTVTCVLIGERPGLATAESMSAYIAYNASIGMPEARRTVVSNIHSAGIATVEAGAYICDVIKAIFDAKASGIELKK